MTRKPRCKITKEEKKTKERFRKRKASLMHKANELAILTDASVYVVIERKRQFSLYKSTEDKAWPPTEDEVMNKWPLPECFKPQDFEEDETVEDHPVSRASTADVDTQGAVRFIMNLSSPPVFPETPIQATFNMSHR